MMQHSLLSWFSEMITIGRDDDRVLLDRDSAQ